jgi:hypothetical protein
MENFLQSISPELRRVVQKITGASSLKKSIAEIVGNKATPSKTDWNTHISAAQKKITIRKNV